MDILNQIEEKMGISKNIYDVIRVVDPVNKSVMIFNEEDFHVEKESCHKFWNKTPFCKNCISMRAYLENDTFVKVETKEDNVFLLTSTPVRINDCNYVLEILKNISKEREFSKKPIDNICSVKFLTEAMNKKSIIDELTGIYNRRYIKEVLPVDMKNSFMNGQPISIAIVQIEEFKSRKPVFENVIKDKVIKDFTKLIKSFIRKDKDWIGRYSDKEFLIVTRNTSEEEAYYMAESIRKKVHGRSFFHDGIEIKVILSYGVSVINNEDIKLETLIATAKENLYKGNQLIKTML